MAEGLYIGVNNVAREAKNMYIGVDGTARKIKKIYTGDANGVAKETFSSLKYSSMCLGSTTKVLVSNDNFTTYSTLTTSTNFSQSSLCYHNGYYYAIGTRTNPGYCIRYIDLYRTEDGVNWEFLNTIDTQYSTNYQLRDLYITAGPTYFLVSMKASDVINQSYEGIRIYKSSSLNLATATWTAQTYVEVDDGKDPNSNPIKRFGDYFVTAIQYGYAYAPISTGIFTFVSSSVARGNEIALFNNAYCTCYNGMYSYSPLGSSATKFLYSNNQLATCMLVYNSKLYFTSSSSIYQMNSTNNGHTQIAGVNGTIAYLYEIDGKLICTSLNSTNGTSYIYESTDGTTFTLKHTLPNISLVRNGMKFGI